MREIKFRAWDKPLNKMFYDIRYHNGYKCNEKEEIFVVMQYTGLKDRNGNEIYEGDVLMCPQGVKGQVYWNDAGFAIMLTSDEMYKALDYYDRTQKTVFEYLPEQLKWFDCEVVGNIYENPELLNQETIK